MDLNSPDLGREKEPVHAAFGKFDSLERLEAGVYQHGVELVFVGMWLDGCGSVDLGKGFVSTSPEFLNSSKLRTILKTCFIKLVL